MRLTQLAKSSAGSRLLVARGQKIQPFLVAGKEQHWNWWEHGNFLEIRLGEFNDVLGTGIGNFKGVTELAPLIRALGYDGVWFTPFLKSGGDDGGYDIVNFREVDPQFGTIDDAKECFDALHANGLRVKMDWVLCHTSDRHPDFQHERRHPPRDPRKAKYLWSDTGTEAVAYIGPDGQLEDVRGILEDREDDEVRWVWVRVGRSRRRRRMPARCWARDPVSGRRYFYRFKPSQPARNFDNPEVEAENLSDMEFWLALGIDGFRVDAVPFLFMRPGTSHEDVEDVHRWIERTKAAIRRKYPHAMLLCESDLPQDQMQAYGDGDQFDALLDFRLRVALALTFALNPRDASPLLHLMLTRPPLPFGVAYWKHRDNHDDLRGQWPQWTLSKQQIKEILRGFYGDGQRGHLFVGDAVVVSFRQMFLDNMRHMKLHDHIQRSFPGAILHYYASIIGMYLDPELALGRDERERGRTGMQWGQGRNALFSEAAELLVALISSGAGAYPLLNFLGELEKPGSLLNYNIRANWRHRSEPLLGFGLAEPLLGFGIPFPEDAAPTQQFGIVRHFDGHDRAIISLSNIAEEEEEPTQFCTELPPHLDRFRNSKIRTLYGDKVVGKLDGRRLDMLLPPEEGYMLAVGRDN